MKSSAIPEGWLNIEVFGRMYRFAIGTVILLFLAMAPQSLAGPPSLGKYLTNVELVQLAVRGALHEGLADLPHLDGDKIAVRSLEQSEIDWLVETELLGRLTPDNKGVRLYKGAPAAATAKKKGGRKNKGALEGLKFSKPPLFASGEKIAVPEKACEKGLGGEVTIRLIINETGSVANKILEAGAGPPFDEAVENGVSSWHFEPAGDDGKAVIGDVYCRFVFPELDSDGCEGAVVEAEFLESYEPAAEVEEAVTAPQAPLAIDMPVLAYRVSELEFLYPSAGRKFWLGPKRVTRFGRTRIELRLEKGEEVIWASSAEHYVSDQVPAGTLPALEGSKYEFSSPPLPQGSGKLVEPLVIAGVVGGMIALFYTNQAAD